MTYSSSYKPTEAYILSLFAGLAISLAGLFWLAMMFIGPALNWGFFMMHGDEAGYYMWDFGIFGLSMGVIGLIVGVAIIGSAIMLQSKPKEHSTWGTVIIILSAFSIFGGMGGMGIGLILGIIGGILAITWTPAEKEQVQHIPVNNPL